MSAALPSPEIINRLHGTFYPDELLQPFLFDTDHKKHVEILLREANFKQDATVLDVGCGTGECAKIMKSLRPDLNFALVNFSEAQLHDCPAEFWQYLADAHDLPFDNEMFDAVMFNASLCNMDMPIALAEAIRVLRPGGTIFINDMVRTDGNNHEMEKTLKCRAATPGQIEATAKGFGCSARVVLPDQYYLNPLIQDENRLFMNVKPVMYTLTKTRDVVAAQFGTVFYKHQKVGLQFSGGKDSLTLLYMMEPWWDRVCVYWLNPGNPLPETVFQMREIASIVPNFKEVPGKQKEIIAADGWPSDVVPVKWTTLGNQVFGPTEFKVQGRLDCCIRSLMIPLHEAIKSDGVTCLFRGKREEEADKTETRSGDYTEDGIQVFYPLWQWTEKEVLQFINDYDIDLPYSYNFTNHSLDCLDCTAWREHGLSRYLAVSGNGDAYQEYHRRMGLIRNAVMASL